MGQRVLVIDDEPRILKALGANLGVRGYDVALASSGEEGLSLASTHAPDAVILDLGLPGIGGLDVITRIRRTLTVP
ncbi:MAG TPA: response regulator, partial [Miltoncostaeales bacterium]|nr:response regulator [Miltoncostaeales bacterium]